LVDGFSLTIRVLVPGGCIQKDTVSTFPYTWANPQQRVKGKPGIREVCKYHLGPKNPGKVPPYAYSPGIFPYKAWVDLIPCGENPIVYLPGTLIVLLSWTHPHLGNPSRAEREPLRKFPDNFLKIGLTFREERCILWYTVYRKLYMC